MKISPPPTPNSPPTMPVRNPTKMKDTTRDRHGRRHVRQHVRLDIAGWSVRTKVWIEVDGRFAIGEGGLALLEGIAATSSLTRAAHRIGWSYRHAWGYLRNAEQIVGVSLVHVLAGKGARRGMMLTPDGWALLDALTALRQRIAQAATDARRRLNQVAEPTGMKPQRLLK